MSSPDSAPQSDQNDVQSQQGLLLTGEGLSAMTPERLEMLEQMVGGLGLEVTVVGDLEALGVHVEEEPQPVPATRETFRVFAEENGYTKARADRAWIVLQFTRGYGLPEGNTDPFPQLRFLDRGGDVVDLRSIHERLMVSDMSTSAWIKASPGTLRFWAGIIDWKIGPEPPLNERLL